ncbi:MAG: carboxylating nicotinate-nucleotide diphosphorylase [Candidatus Eiseniibacteriota bacterium]
MKLETFAGPIVQLALTEDLGAGDVTTEAVVSEQARARAHIVARQPGVVAGLEVVRLTFQRLDAESVLRTRRRDGDRVEPGEVVCVIDGRARGILSAERVALNFLQHLSGIATATARFVEAIEGTGAQVRDTRKTTPVLRMLEKYAVRVGGGKNHRFGLFDMVLLKENHLSAAGSIAAAVDAARRRAPELAVEVEARTTEEAMAAAGAGADWILLDNMTPDEVRATVERLRAGQATEKPRRPLLEASGRIELSNARAFAETGVDAISVGAVTHSAPALDFSLLFESISDLA